MRKLGVSLIANSSVHEEEQIKMIKNSGFDCFFSLYYGDEPIEKWKDIAVSVGLEYETLHFPFHISDSLCVNYMWEDTLNGESFFKLILKQIDGCQRAEIPIAIMHVSCCSVAPAISDIGINRFRKICDYAQEHNVKLAFENLELPEYLHSVMNEASSFHGFCWDCGHNLCYTPHLDLLETYKNRLLCTHIHDNLGVTKPGDIHWHDDLHLLPFDGSMNWQWFGKKIKESGYTGPLTLELSLKSRAEYQNQPLENFFHTAFERAQKLRELSK